MATITSTPTLAQIVAASQASGVSIADIIIAIDKSLTDTPAPMPATVRKPAKVAQTTPAAKTRKRAQKTADKRNVTQTWQMTRAQREARYASGAFWQGLASRNQREWLENFTNEHGYDPFTADEIRNMSAIDAAEWRVWLERDVRGIEQD